MADSVNKIKIDVNSDVTSRLGLEPIKDATGGYLYGGLVPVVFEGCHLTTQTPEKGQFEGLEVKVLNFEFTNYKLNSSDPDRFLTQQEKVIGSVKKDGEGYAPMEDKVVTDLVKNMWGRVKHILDATKGLPNYRNIAEDKKFLKLIELPLTQDAPTLVEAYNAFFTFICDFVNGDGTNTKPIYLNKDGKPFTAWLKILPEYNNGKWYTVPTYVGTGFIERASFSKEGVILPASIIKVKPSETLELSGAKKAAGNQMMPQIAGNTIPGNVAAALGIG